jgi:hypothetical protein
VASKGLSNVELGASALLRRWVTADGATTRAVVGSRWRAQRREREAVDEERGGIVAKELFARYKGVDVDQLMLEVAWYHTWE